MCSGEETYEHVAYKYHRNRNSKKNRVNEQKTAMLHNYIYTEAAVSERLSQGKPTNIQESVSGMVAKLRTIEKAIENRGIIDATQ
jgi:hypothetical protein